MARARGGERVEQRHGPEDSSARGGKHSVLQLIRRWGPQDRHLRRTVEQNVDAVTFPFLDVPEPQMGNQLVEVLQKIDTRTSHQVVEVPKIFPDKVPLRLVLHRWRNS